MMHSDSPQRAPRQAQRCEQDFCQGAEALNSFHPPFSTPPSSSVVNEHLDEWMEIRDSFGCDVLDAFSDVILSDDFDGCNNQAVTPPINLQPIINDDFKSQPKLFLHDLDESQLFGGISNSYLNEISYDPIEIEESTKESLRPKFTIKLKKVKGPSKQKLPSVDPLNNFQVVSNAFQNDFLEDLVDAGSEGFISSFLNLDEGDIISNSAPSPILTLKDALNMEDADEILENYLSSGPSSPPDTASEQSYMSGSEDNTQTLLFSPVHSAFPVTEKSSPPHQNESDDFQFTSKRKSKSSKCKKTKSRLSPESRYIRKKEQNKQAALRYRMKKKQEEELLSDSIQTEERRKEELQKSCSSLGQEIKFIKKLMRESLIVRKLVPPDAFH